MRASLGVVVACPRGAGSCTPAAILTGRRGWRCPRWWDRGAAGRAAGRAGVPQAGRGDRGAAPAPRPPRATLTPGRGQQGSCPRRKRGLQASSPRSPERILVPRNDLLFSDSCDGQHVTTSGDTAPGPLPGNLGCCSQLQLAEAALGVGRRRPPSGPQHARLALWQPERT